MSIVPSMTHGYLALCVLRQGSVPFLVICLLTWAAVHSQPSLGGAGQDMASTLALWLHLPAILLSAVALAATLESWPLLSRDRPGAKHLARLPIGPLHGCGMVSVATLLILALSLCAAALLFDWQMHREGRSQPVHAISPAAASPGQEAWALGPVHRSQRFSFAADTIADRLELRPLAVLRARGSYRSTGIQIFADDQILNKKPLQVDGNSEFLSVAFAPRKLRHIEIRVTDPGNIQVKFPRGSLLAISADSYPSALNCMFAALSYLFPTSLSLAVLCLLRNSLSLPLALALASSLILVCTLGDFTPNSQAVQAYSRGLWIPSVGLAPASLATLGVVGGLLLAASLIPRRGLGGN